MTVELNTPELLPNRVKDMKCGNNRIFADSSLFVSRLHVGVDEFMTLMKCLSRYQTIGNSL